MGRSFARDFRVRVRDSVAEIAGIAGLTNRSEWNAQPQSGPSRARLRSECLFPRTEVPSLASCRRPGRGCGIPAPTETAFARDGY